MSYNKKNLLFAAILLSFPTLGFSMKRSDSKFSLLKIAVESGDLKGVKEQIGQFHDPVTLVNSSGLFGVTPLHTVAEKGYKDIAACLIGWEAKVTARDDNGGTPLHFAAHAGSFEIVSILIKELIKKSKWNLIGAKNNAGETPLAIAEEQLEIARRQKSKVEQYTKTVEFLQDPFKAFSKKSTKSKKEKTDSLEVGVQTPNTAKRVRYEEVFQIEKL